jgi:hypothetical protein
MLSFVGSGRTLTPLAFVTTARMIAISSGEALPEII